MPALKEFSSTAWMYPPCWIPEKSRIYQRFALSFVSFLRRKHDFRRRLSTFVWRILFEEPRIWRSGLNLRTRVLQSVTAAQERLDMRSGCHVAKILPVGVRGTTIRELKHQTFFLFRHGQGYTHHVHSKITSHLLLSCIKLNMATNNNFRYCCIITIYIYICISISVRLTH